MRQHTILSLLILFFFHQPYRVGSQTYNLSVPVDEIVLTFHVSDPRGLSIADLKLEDLHLLDNGQLPRKILSFTATQDRPIRAGILLDTSDSMTYAASGNRALATRYIQHLLEQQADQAFTVKFAFQSEITQPWTANNAALTSGLKRFVSVRSRPGTAVFDTIYRACLNQFAHTTSPDTANFILLFSDGEDNASRSTLKDAVDICQHTNTAIYAVRARTAAALSSGITTLSDLTSQTGGRILYADDSDAQVLSDVRAIEADLRNQYQLIYRPGSLTHDGSFHRIELTTPRREAAITVRSGYYAPWR
jgi:VWFA-related protein